MALTAEQAPLQTPYSTIDFDTPQKRYVRELRIQEVARETFTRRLITDLVIDPPETKCPEDAIGATQVGPEHYLMRVSTIDLGAIGGVEEQVAALHALINLIAESAAAPNYQSVTPFRRKAGFNNGKDIPALTASAVVGPDGVSTPDIERTLVRPRIFKLSPVNRIRDLSSFALCAAAAKSYLPSSHNAPRLPRLEQPVEKIEPDQVVAVYADFGNQIINHLVQEAGLPLIVDVGIERTAVRRRKYYKVINDVTEVEPGRARHLVPCMSLSSSFNQLLIAEFLAKGACSFTPDQSRIFANWINSLSLKDRENLMSSGA